MRDTKHEKHYMKTLHEHCLSLGDFPGGISLFTDNKTKKEHKRNMTRTEKKFPKENENCKTLYICKLCIMNLRKSVHFVMQIVSCNVTCFLHKFDTIIS